MDPRLAMHTISCLNPLNKRDHEHSFLLDEILSDIGLNKWRWPPWRPLSTLLIAFVSFIIRVQLHYMGMAGMLLLLQRPIYEMKGESKHHFPLSPFFSAFFSFPSSLHIHTYIYSFLVYFCLLPSVCNVCIA